MRRKGTKRVSHNPLLRRKSGTFYKTSYRRVYALTTSSDTPGWASCTVNLLTKSPEGSGNGYIDQLDVDPAGVAEAVRSIFDQKKITGVRLRLILPQSGGSTYSFPNGHVVNIQPHRVVWGYDENNQIGTGATPSQLQAKSGYQTMAVPPSGTITRYFNTARMLRRVGLGLGWTQVDDLTYNGQIQDGKGPSCHVRLLSGIQGEYSQFPPGTVFGTIEITYYVLYRGRKAPE